MFTPSDIIVAVATAPGPSAISVVRLSGAGTHALALRLCRDLLAPPIERRLTLTWLIHPTSGRLLDQALVAFFSPEASYTGEEVVEFFCHGGRVVPERVLGACLAVGARPARPGEFTRRALASGRLDLLQAEAVALLADAQTEAAADFALAALAQEPSRAVSALREDLLDVLAECEAALDFADEDGIEVSQDHVSATLCNSVARMDEWLVEARAARPCLEGVRVVIVGPPNAGKSSLFNALLGRDRAIVHEEPGTTRDVVTEPIHLGGVPCVLVDTAGLREVTAAVEAEGVRRTFLAVREADIVVLVLDGCEPGFLDDIVPCDVCVATKSDLWTGQGPAFLASSGVPWCATSARTGAGVSHLRDLLAALARDRFEKGRAARGLFAGERQIEAVAAAREEVLAAASLINRAQPLEVAASHLHRAVERLSELTGARVTEEVLDRVFSRFCVGK